MDCKMASKGMDQKRVRLNVGARICGAAAMLVVLGSVIALGLDPEAGPESPDSARPTLQDIADRLETGADAFDPTRPGFVAPESGPSLENGMPTLNELMDLMPHPSDNAATSANVREGRVMWSLDTNTWGGVTGTAPVQVVSPGTNILQVGFYDETVWSDVEVDLVPENIRQDIVILGVTGKTPFQSPWPAPVARTGMTNRFAPFDDGSLLPGEPWPVPRFDTDDDVVVDNVTGLMWLKAPPTATYGRSAGITFITGQSWGGFNDWRLPTLQEFLSLLDYGQYEPALAESHPFDLPTDEGSFGSYHVSTWRTIDPSSSYHISLDNGRFWGTGVPTFPRFIWPVRGPVEE